MSSVAKSLVENEKIVYHAHIHWILFFRPVSIVVGSLVMLGYSTLVPSLASYIQLLAYGVFAFGGIRFMIEFIKVRSHELVITDRRIFIKEGVFNTKSTTINLSHIETVELSQSLLGRILDFGTIEISASSGVGTEEPLHYISHPNIFRKKIQAYISSKKSNKGGGKH